MLTTWFSEAVTRDGGPVTFLIDEVLDLRTFENFPGLRHVQREFISRLAAGRGNVRHVLVGGRFVVEDFRSTTVDVEELARAIAPVAARIGPLLRARRYQPLPRFGGQPPGRA